MHLFGTREVFGDETKRVRLGFRARDIRIDPIATRKTPDLRMIDGSIGLMPFEVFISIFRTGDEENDEEGENDKALE